MPALFHRPPCPAAALAAALIGGPLPLAQALEAGVAGGAVQLRADEQLQGAAFNAERGTVDGAAAWVRHEHGPFGLRLRADGEHGSVAYDGRTQFGLPLQTRTQWRREALALDAHAWSRLPGLPDTLQLGAALQLRSWRSRRAIQPTFFTSELIESFSVADAGLGPAVRWAWGDGARARWQLDARWLAVRPYRQVLRVQAPGVFDPVVLAPARRSGSQGELALAWRPAPGPVGAWQVQAAWAHERFQAGPSDLALVQRGPVPVGLVVYPGGTLSRTSLVLGVGRAF
jgi:hypothetical protein